jgi:hypothetical protein
MLLHAVACCFMLFARFHAVSMKPRQRLQSKIQIAGMPIMIGVPSLKARLSIPCLDIYKSFNNGQNLQTGQPASMDARWPGIISCRHHLFALEIVTNQWSSGFISDPFCTLIKVVVQIVTYSLDHPYDPNGKTSWTPMYSWLPTLVPRRNSLFPSQSRIH